MARRKTRRQKGGGNLIVQYPTAQVDGKKLPLTAVQGTPSVTLHVRPTPFHTLIMHDPDALGHNNTRPWLHWLVINIPGSDFSAGEQLLMYSSPKPPSGIHRYKFTLYEQRFGRVQIAKLPQPDNFHLVDFVHDNNLLKVGEVCMRVAALPLQ